MRSPSRAEGPATASAVSGPLYVEHASRPLDTLNTPSLAAQQARFLSRRFGIRADRARLVAGLAFSAEVRS